ncbi:MAG: hypothetical protein HY248_01410, partial [Fimbriimonas ginsengisoli]|nr:hypothetical protein [Fimbriimonas ginsengisoli]
MLAVAGLTVWAGADRPVIYAAGHSLKDQRIALTAWGSGTVAESDETAFEGTKSIRISSRNFFQGGILSFGSPINLSEAFSDTNNLVRLTFRFADSNMTIPGGPNPQGNPGRGGGRGGDGYAPVIPGVSIGFGFMQRGGGGEGGGGGQGQPQPGAQPVAVRPPVPPALLDTIRVIVTTTDNLKSELYLPVANSSRAERGWRTTSFPLQAVSGFARTNKVVRQIAVSLESTATMFVGDIRVVQDSTPISVDVNATTLNLALNDKVTLRARGFAGSTLL